MALQRLDNNATLEASEMPSNTLFVEVRHPRTLRLLARYNPVTREIEIIDSRRERHIIDLKRYEPAPPH